MGGIRESDAVSEAGPQAPLQASSDGSTTRRTRSKAWSRTHSMRRAPSASGPCRRRLWVNASRSP